jgi:Holliday junction resolvasome RuvABC endonuclease subunit
MKILALDPGEITGVCIIDWPHNRQIKPREDMSPYIKYQGHIEGKHLHIQAKRLEELRNEYGPFAYVIFEKFLLYGHKASTQIGSDMHTSQVIGVIKMWCINNNMPMIEQMAQNAKKFYTDNKLKDHKVYPVGLRHSKDATRHALYAIDFNIFKGLR